MVHPCSRSHLMRLLIHASAERPRPTSLLSRRSCSKLRAEYVPLAASSQPDSALLPAPDSPITATVVTLLAIAKPGLASDMAARVAPELAVHA